MALNFPSSPNNGDQYTDDNGRIWKYDGTAWAPYVGSATRLFKGAKLTLSSAEAATATLTAVTWDAAAYNVGGIFNGDNNTRLTASDTGYYRINATLITGTGGSGNSYTVTIKKNGSATVATIVAGPNQSVIFDDVIYLINDEYIEIYISESTAAGTLTTASVVEMNLVGTAPGTSTYNNANAFSGVKVELTGVEAATASATAITWDDDIFNENADATGNVYWTVSESANITFYTTGYYRVKAHIVTGSGGSTGSYTINLRKNETTTLETATLSPNDTLDYDETLQLNSDDVLQIEIAESGAAGTILANSYFQVTRTGV